MKLRVNKTKLYMLCSLSFPLPKLRSTGYYKPVGVDFWWLDFISPNGVKHSVSFYLRHGGFVLQDYVCHDCFLIRARCYDVTSDQLIDIGIIPKAPVDSTATPPSSQTASCQPQPQKTAPDSTKRFYSARSQLYGITVYDRTTQRPAYEYGASQNMDEVSASVLAMHLNVRARFGRLASCSVAPPAASPPVTFQARASPSV